MKKILILTSIGGGGHISTSSALFSYLSKDFEIQTINLFKDLLSPLDLFHKLTFGRFHGEDIYNYFISKKKVWILTLFYKLGIWNIALQKRKIKKIVLDYIKQNNYDLIISVIPFANHIILEAAQELNIPFLLIPTDLDLRTYLIGISQPQYEKFYLAIPFYDKRIYAQIDDAKIPHHHIHIIGALLRNDFYLMKNTHHLKNELNLPKDKHIVMILMGAQGSCEMVKFIQALSAITVPIHIIACIGKYNSIKTKLNSIKLPPHISLSIITFTSHIADFMTTADILITKSGSISVFESIYMHTPMLLDATSMILPWEEFNHHFIKQHNFGTSISSYKHVAPLTESILKNKKVLSFYKTNLIQFHKKNGKEEIIKLINTILIKNK